MDASADRPEFEPPPPQGMWRGFALAVLAHVLLIAALTVGLRWQRESQDVAVEAELWSRVPQEAAPKEVAPPPPPPPAPEVKAQPRPEPPAQREADIALEREKQKRELEKQRQAELERERLEHKRKLEAQKKHEQELANKKREEELAKKKREEELAKKQDQARQVAEAKRKEEDKKHKEQEAKEQREAKLREKLREDTIKRSLAMAGTGAPSSSGNAAQASGPSAGWGARVQARVRPNIVFADTVEGNPKAEVEVRTSPDGTIVAKRLVRSSGVKAWDEAVLRALDKTEALPRDVDGRVPSPVIIAFRPHD
jgi:colicin import membrane protein